MVARYPGTDVLVKVENVVRHGHIYMLGPDDKQVLLCVPFLRTRICGACTLAKCHVRISTTPTRIPVTLMKVKKLREILGESTVLGLAWNLP